MILSAIRTLFPKQAEKVEFSQQDAWIGDAIWVASAILYFTFVD